MTSNLTTKGRRQTLVFIKRADEVLLGMKKRDFGAQKWNGYGGKCEDGESYVDCAIRELHEESHIVIAQEDLKYLGYLKFTYQKNIETEGDRIVQVFSVDGTALDSDNAVETDEMKPQWFLFKDIPWKSMFADAAHWLPHVLEEKRFVASFLLNPDQSLRLVQVDFPLSDEFKELQIAQLSN